MRKRGRWIRTGGSWHFAETPSMEIEGMPWHKRLVAKIARFASVEPRNPRRVSFKKYWRSIRGMDGSRGERRKAARLSWKNRGS